MMKKKKAYIELNSKLPHDNPTLMWKRPTQKELENAKEFHYKVYECEVIIGERLI